MIGGFNIEFCKNGFRILFSYLPQLLLKFFSLNSEFSQSERLLMSFIYSIIQQTLTFLNFLNKSCLFFVFLFMKQNSFIQFQSDVGTIFQHTLKRLINIQDTLLAVFYLQITFSNCSIKLLLTLSCFFTFTL